MEKIRWLFFLVSPIFFLPWKEINNVERRRKKSNFLLIYELPLKSFQLFLTNFSNWAISKMNLFRGEGIVTGGWNYSRRWIEDWEFPRFPFHLFYYRTLGNFTIYFALVEQTKYEFGPSLDQLSVSCTNQPPGCILFLFY